MKITIKTIQKAIKELRKNNEKNYQLYLVFNKFEWLHHPFIKWTEKEIDNAHPITGFIGTKHGVDCYLSRFLICK